MGITLFICSLVIDVKHANTAMELVTTFLTAGGSLLGLGLFEKSKSEPNPPESNPSQP